MSRTPVQSELDSVLRRLLPYLEGEAYAASRQVLVDHSAGGWSRLLGDKSQTAISASSSPGSALLFLWPETSGNVRDNELWRSSGAGKAWDDLPPDTWIDPDEWRLLKV